MAVAAVAAFVAAGAGAYVARRSPRQWRAAWGLLAASAASWALAQTIGLIFQNGPNGELSAESFANLGYLGSTSLAVAGILAMPVAPQSAVNRLRAILDGAVVAGALVFIALSVGMDRLIAQTPGESWAAVVALGNPAGDVIVLTVLVVALMSGGWTRRSAVLFGAAFMAKVAADATFVYTSLARGGDSIGFPVDYGWAIAYILLTLAALSPVSGAQSKAKDEPVTPWQLALPWVAVLAFIVTAGWLSATGQPLDAFKTGVADITGFMFVLSQGLVINDSRRLIKANRVTEAELRAQTTLLNEVITRAPQGIARVDINLSVVDANPRLALLLATPVSRLIGSPVSEYLAPDELARVAEKFSPLWGGIVDSIEGDSQVQRADGTSIWMHWTVTAVRKTDDKIDYFLAMFDDVTRRHEADQVAMANLAGLERLSRLKSEFMSMVSHEFRTALTGIQGYSELMSGEDVSADEVKEFSGDINSDAMRLNRMITEMLDLDRIESGRVSLHLGPVDLNSILLEATERARVSSQKHSIRAALDTGLPQIEGDSDRLIQVVTNLLSNAVKYSPEGGEVLVTSRVVDDTVQVTVKDEGPGIPPEFIGKIFGRYERYEGQGRAEVVGTGLGLAIAQQIIQLHKGRIWVESRVGEGAEFHFALPLPPGPALAAQSPSNIDRAASS